MASQVKNTLSSGIVPVLIENTTEETVPSYSIVAIGETASLATGEMTRPGTGVGVGPFKIPVRKPDAISVENGSPALFLFSLDLPIGAGKVGYATASVPTWAQLDTDTYERGDRLGPEADSWKLHRDESGQYGLRDIHAGLAWVDLLGGGGGGGGALFQFSLTTDVASTTATGDIMPASGGTAIATGQTLHDPLNIFLSLKSGGVGFCILQDGDYYIIQARCAPEVEVGYP